MDASFEVVWACMRELDAARREIARLQAVVEELEAMIYESTRLADVMRAGLSEATYRQVIENVERRLYDETKGARDG